MTGMNAASGHSARIDWSVDRENHIHLTSFGDWTVTALGDVAERLEQCAKSCRKQSIQWDVSRVESVDSAGMWVFIRNLDRFESNQCIVSIVGAKTEQKKMYRLLRKYTPVDTAATIDSITGIETLFKGIGRSSVDFAQNFSQFLAFLGENFINLVFSIRHPTSIRFASIIKNIDEAGVRALPIVALTSFLIGVVIAYQGAVQLEKFGANIFVVDMIGISLTRELAPLITAIVVAGRTGSSYTAQLGVMKLTEEIDAMKTMGFDPHRFLVLPRMIALIIALPLMIFFADLVGIFGGMVISHLHLHLSFSEFIHRLQSVLDVKHVWIGIGKGPFFAWLIAAVGCFNGFQVSRNTESIGRFTTISVVNAIFLVIACDAIFSVILTELGI